MTTRHTTAVSDLLARAALLKDAVPDEAGDHQKATQGLQRIAASLAPETKP